MISGQSSDDEKHFVGGPPLPKSKYNMADGRHLENRHDVIFPQWMFLFGRNSAAGCRILQITAKWSGSSFGSTNRFYLIINPNYLEPETDHRSRFIDTDIEVQSA